jgi:hypothetical protein
MRCDLMGVGVGFGLYWSRSGDAAGGSGSGIAAAIAGLMGRLSAVVRG